MKLFSVQAFTPAMLDPLVLGPLSVADQFAQIVAKQLNIYADGGREVSQYSTFFAGDILTDEGVVINYSETLSLDDDHHQPDDLEYALDQMKDYQFGAFVWWENDLMIVLSFAK